MSGLLPVVGSQSDSSRDLLSLPSKELDVSFAVTAASWMPFVSTVRLYFAVIPELPNK